MVGRGEKYDLIFIDAGHDLYSVIHDLTYATQLLAEGGWILMDDFAPASDYGLATCVASSHARRFFDVVEVIPTEGVVYGDTQIPGLPRCMVLLGESRGNVVMAGWKLWFWRLAGKVMDACYREGLFPLATP
jgi:hypothetical protein